MQTETKPVSVQAQFYEQFKAQIPKGVDHKEYERRAKEAARKAGL